MLRILLNITFSFWIGLIGVAQDTEFWGMTHAGGKYNAGVIFKTDADGNNYEIVKHFPWQDGALPAESRICEADNGKLYGVTTMGGEHDMGALYEYDPVTNDYTVKVNFQQFNTGKFPVSIMKADNGLLYGIVPQGGSDNRGVLFEYNYVDNIFTKKHEFVSSQGFPDGMLIQANDGKLYGTIVGGENLSGTITYGGLFTFDITTDTYAIEKLFDDSNTANSRPQSIMQASNGKLYGVSDTSGLYDEGFLYEYDFNSGAFAIKHHFKSDLGTDPCDKLVEATNGKLYGTTQTGGSNGKGVIFSYDYSVDSYVLEVNFNGINGQTPLSSLELSNNGLLYGGAYSSNGIGVIYEFDPITNDVTIVTEYVGYGNKGVPYGNLFEASNGLLYGSASNAAEGKGELFSYSRTDDKLTSVIIFGAVTGRQPHGALVQASNGNLYGTTHYGGIHVDSDVGQGVLFEYDMTSGIYSKRIDFDIEGLGRYPIGSLIEADNGLLYGLTDGGLDRDGTLFEFDPSTNVGKRIRYFDETDPSLGINPVASLIKGNNGLLYGLTFLGGTYGDGVLFEFNPQTKVYTKKLDFNSTNKGGRPVGIMFASNGLIYGTTFDGGVYDKGVLFEYDPYTEAYSDLIDFDGAHKGSLPAGILTETGSGLLYGITKSGGDFNAGVIYAFNPTTGYFETRHNFDHTNGRPQIKNTLTVGNDGLLYGVTTYGGTGYVNGTGIGAGTLFVYDPVNHIFTKKKDFTRDKGLAPEAYLVTVDAGCLGSITKTHDITACSDYTVPSGDETYSTSGTYRDTIPRVCGEDSIITINLTVLSGELSTSPLADVTDPTSVTLTPPTATNACGDVITATTSDPLTYSESGMYTITWLYDDGNGNTSTQIQKVIVGDVVCKTTEIELEWVRTIGGTDNDAGYSIVTDANGNVYSTGSFRGTADLDPGVGTNMVTSRGGEDVFIQKLDADGGFEWATTFGGVNSESGVSVTVDVNGDVYTAGSFSDVLSFDSYGGKLTSAGSYDAFIYKQDTDGNLLWVKSFGGTNIEKVYGITTDMDGNVYTTGYFRETADFDPSAGTKTVTSIGVSDVFIQKLDSNGNFLWVKTFGGLSSESAQSITTDVNGNVYTAGYYNGTVDFDPSAGTSNVTSNGGSDVFIQKLDSNGDFLWAKTFGGLGSESSESIALDSNGNVYITGKFSETVDFDPGAGIENLSSNGDADVFVQKLNTDGDFIWAKTLGGSAFDMGTSIICSADGGIYTTGLFYETILFDPAYGANSITSNGYFDVFIQKFDVDGNVLWVQSFGSTDRDRGEGITVGVNGTIYTTGYFNGTVDFDSGVGTNSITSAGKKDVYIQKITQSGLLCDIVHEISVSACGDYTSPSGKIWTATGLYKDTLNTDGNNNIYTIDLTILDAYTETDEVTICASELPYTFGNQKLQSAGTYTEMFTATDGCDSTVELTLGVLSDEYIYPSLTDATDPSSVTLTPPTATNACGDIITATTTDPTEYSGNGVHTVTWTFDEGNGNTTSQTQNVIVGDIICEEGRLNWAKSVSGTSTEYSEDLVVDASGSVYTIGTFSGSTDFDPNEGTTLLTSAGSKDIFIQKLDRDGNLVWVRQLGSIGFDYGNSIAIDQSGDIYITGYFHETVDFGLGATSYPMTSMGESDAFVLKIDTKGNLIWAKQFSGSGDVQGASIKVDAQDNVYTLGHFVGKADFNPSSGTSFHTSAGLWDVFIQKMDTHGNFLWVKRMGGSGNDLGEDLHLDQSYNILSTGYFSGTADYDPSSGTTILSSSGEVDAFIQKLDSDGNFLWANKIGGSNYDKGYSITTDNSGNVFTTGYFMETVDFDPSDNVEELSSFGGNDMFIQKQNASGDFVWVKHMGGTRGEWGRAIETDIYGSIYTTGIFNTTVDFDPNSGISNLSSSGRGDVFVQKLDNAGEFIWAKKMGGTGNDIGNSIVVDVSGTLFLTGYFEGEVDFDPGIGISKLIATDGLDGFIVKLSPNGTFCHTASSITETSCGEYISPSGKTWTTTGEYYDTLTANGYDSIIKVNLTIQSGYTETDEVTLCASELPYTFGTKQFQSAGTYTEVFASVHGCDSTVTLTLNVNPIFTETDEVTLCASELPYTFGTKQLQLAGTYTEVFASVHGCDSTVTLTLNVNPVFTETDEATICASELPYTFGTKQLQSEGTYTEVFTSVDGCDSTVTLTLNVNPIFTETDEVTLCASELPYTFGTKQLQSAGIYTEVFASADGCDSTVTLTLNVNPIFTETDEVTICASQLPYVFGSQSLNVAGTYTEVFISAHGCDSTVTLTLNVNPEYNEVKRDTICEGQTYTFGSQLLTKKGEFNELFESVALCDSAVTLQLEVNPVFTTDIVASICTGGEFILGVQTLTSGGDYTELFVSEKGCDSTVNVKLTVSDKYEVPVEASICQGQTYTFAGNDLDAQGLYEETFTSKAGCDSVVSLDLTVSPVYSETASAAICKGENLIFGAQTLTESGEFTELFTTVAGCDSTVKLTLTVHDTYSETDNQAVCESELPYTFGTQQLDKGGLFIEHFQSKDLCDSTVALTLTVNPEHTVDASHEVAYGETYQFGTQLLDETDTYTEVFTSSDGCDSTVNLVFTVLDPEDVVHEISETACGSFNFNGEELAESGLYKDTLAGGAVTGADSIVILELTVYPEYDTTTEETVAYGETYEFADTLLATSGMYVRTFTSLNGCDSTVRLTFTVADPETIITNLIETACGSFVFAGKDLTESGIYKDTLVGGTVTGADSVVILDLTIYSEYEITVQETAVFGKPYLFVDTLLETAGTYTHTFQSVQGCDSTVTLDFRVSGPETITTNLIETACGSFSFAGKDLIESGVYKDSLKTKTGIDSIVVLDLTIYPEYENSIEKVSAFGESYLFVDTLLTTSGIYVRTLESDNGCDSIVTLSFTVANPETVITNLKEVVCESFIFHGNELTQSGIYKDTLMTVAGTDSVVVLDLTIGQFTENEEYINICYGDSFEGLTKSGVYVRSLESVSGCDSIITTYLTVQPYYGSSEQITIYAGTNYKGFSETGVHTLILKSATGCDSIHTIDLTVGSFYEVYEYLSICDGEQYETYTQSGNYTRTLTASNGADSIVNTILTVYPVDTVYQAVTICAGENYYQWDTTGVYTQVLNSEYGCDSIVITDLTVLPTYETSETLTICNGSDYKGYSEPGTFIQQLETINGCDSVHTIELSVDNFFQVYEYITICSNTSYEGYTQSETFNRTLTSLEGCDSIITTYLTVTATDSVFENVTICEGTSYDGYSEEGRFVKTVTSTQTGCDSVITLNLTVNPIYNINESITVCEGGSYKEWNLSGDYSTTYISVHGCDSTVNTALTVLPKIENFVEIVICEGESYNGIPEAGIYVDTLQSHQGCDSIVTTDLKFAPLYETPTEVVINNGSSIELEGVEQSREGVYYDTLHSIYGCDSIIITELLVNYAPVLIAEVPAQVADVDGKFISVPLNGYIQDDNSLNSNINWKVEGNKHVHVIFKNGIVEASLFDETWTGTETVTFVAIDENGAELKIEVDFTVPAKTGFGSEVSFEVEVSPVPVTDICTVSFSGIHSDVSIRVLSIDGITPVLNSLGVNAGVSSADVDLSVLPAGAYFVEVQSDYGTVLKKIVKE